jgi:uncharacterized HAD superfamily protein
MRKIRVSFEVTDVWTREDFRLFVDLLRKDCDERFILFIISQDEDTDYIETVGEILDIDSDRIIECSDQEDKLDAVANNHIDIHFDNYQQNVLDINEDTETTAILVNFNVNENGKMKYIEQFERELKLIEDEV